MPRRHLHILLVALCLVASLCGQDNPTRPNETELRNLTAVAERGDAEAQFLLGRYYSGQKNDDGKKLAIRWLRRAAKQDHLDAQVLLAWELMGSSPDECMDWYRKAAARGHPVAQHQLGYFLANEDPAASRDWYRKAATQGYESSQMALALIYLRGLGTPVDEVEALKWFELAAKQGNLNARWNVANIREHGKAGLPADLPLAIDLYLACLAEDHAPSYNQLARLVKAGKAAARKGEVCFALGRYEEARGRNPLNHYALSGEAGHAPGALAAARIWLAKGFEKEAIGMWQRAARQGSEEAQAELRRRNQTW